MKTDWVRRKPDASFRSQQVANQGRHARTQLFSKQLGSTNSFAARPRFAFFFCHATGWHAFSPRRLVFSISISILFPRHATIPPPSALLGIVQAYILHDGLQSEPTEFERRLAEGAFRDLDDLRASHSAMLLGVLDRCVPMLPKCFWPPQTSHPGGRGEARLQVVQIWLVEILVDPRGSTSRAR